MKIDFVKRDDILNWLELAKEVEHLFGPMVSDINFHKAMDKAITEKRAFCIHYKNELLDNSLCGVIVISEENNEILWLAVADKHKRKGYGKLLLEYAIKKLALDKPITVQTFDKETKAGVSARNLYLKMGFKEITKAGLNPAGISTVILQFSRSKKTPIMLGSD